MESKRVLSVQSVVAHGYVGNRSATFPLQLLGWDVDSIATVQLSNHKGYGRFRGRAADPADMLEIFDGLVDATLDDYDSVLSGFAASSAQVDAVRAMIERLRARRPDLQWVLDPVLGDNGALYVDAALIPAYRSVLGLATVVTPNHYEAGLLTGVEVDSVPSAIRAIEVLHTEYGVRNVVISSARIRTRASAEPALVCLASTRRERDKSARVAAYVIPVLRGIFVGTGDLFSALMLHHYHEQTLGADAGARGAASGDDAPACETPLARATELVLGTMGMVLRQTASAAAEYEQAQQRAAAAGAPADLPPSAEADPAMLRVWRMKANELRIIQSQQQLVNKERVVVKAQPVEDLM